MPGPLRFATIVFDLDGTLTDSGPGIARCIEHACRRLGVEPPAGESLRAWVGPPLRESFARHLDGGSTGEVERAVALYRERYATLGILECELYPGISELLTALAGSGASLRLATCKPEPFARRILERFEIARLFDTVSAASMESGFDRKDQVLGVAVASLSPEERLSAVMIGDRGEDILAARGLGLTSVAVSYGYGAGSEIAGARPDHVAADVAALRALLLESETGD